jgi:esterase/lipase
MLPKKINRVFKKIVWLLLVIILVIVHQSCFMMRWTDKKATKVFSAKKVPLQLKDFKSEKAGIIHYAICETDSIKPLLVFVHGSPGSWFNYMKYMWDSAMRTKYNMISVDRPGFGFSNFGETKNIFEQADGLLALLHQEAKGRKIILAGHSMGGPIVSAMAQKEPDFVNTLILMAASIDLGQETKEKWRIIMHKNPLKYLLPGAFRPSNDELLQLKKDLVILDKNFDKITCKVIFVHALGDNMVPFENVNFGLKAITNYSSMDSLFFSKKDNHFIPWKRQQEIIDKLLTLKF